MTEQNQPYFIILGGPTGSGKSLMPDLILNHLRKTNGEKYSFKKLLIDDYIEYNPLYKDSIHHIIEEYECVPRKTGKGDKCDIETPSPELANAFSEIYFDIRRNETCYREYTEQMKDKAKIKMFENIKKKYKDEYGKTFTKNEEFKKKYDNEIETLSNYYDDYYKKNCEKQYKMDLEKYLNLKDNIIVETTGKIVPVDLIKLAKDHNYKIIIAYILVKTNILHTRIIKRFRDALYKFKLDYHKKAPRFPNISDEIINNIKETLITLRNDCLHTDEALEGCGLINRDSNINLLIYDNTDSNYIEPKLVYDHSIPSEDHLYMKKPEYIEFINKLLYVITPEEQARQLFTKLPKYIETGGKNRRRTVRKYSSKRRTKTLRSKK